MAVARPASWQSAAAGAADWLYRCCPANGQQKPACCGFFWLRRQCAIAGNGSLFTGHAVLWHSRQRHKKIPQRRACSSSGGWQQSGCICGIAAACAYLGATPNAWAACMDGTRRSRRFVHRRSLCDVLPPDSIDQPCFGQHRYLSCARVCAALWANFSARSHHPCHAGLRGNYRAGHCTINAGSSEQITAAPISHPRGHICPPCMAYRIATEKSATAPAAGHAFARLCQRQQALTTKSPHHANTCFPWPFFMPCAGTLQRCGSGLRPFYATCGPACAALAARKYGQA